MSFQIQHIIHGFYCGDYQGASFFWPGNKITLPIFKFKDRAEAQNTIDLWVANFGMDKEWAVIRPFNEKLSLQISLQASPVEGKC